MNTEQDPEMQNQTIDKFLNALLIVFHEIGAEPAEGEKIFSESSLDFDENGLFRYILPNHFLYTLSEEQVKTSGFAESDNGVVIPIVDDRYFVLVKS